MHSLPPLPARCAPTFPRMSSRAMPDPGPGPSPLDPNVAQDTMRKTIASPPTRRAGGRAPTLPQTPAARAPRKERQRNGGRETESGAPRRPFPRARTRAPRPDRCPTSCELCRERLPSTGSADPLTSGMCRAACVNQAAWRLLSTTKSDRWTACDHRDDTSKFLDCAPPALWSLPFLEP